MRNEINQLILNNVVFISICGLFQWFTIKMNDGVIASSYSEGDKFYIDPMKLLPLERFLPQPKGSGDRGGGRGRGLRGRGGRSSFRKLWLSSKPNICGKLWNPWKQGSHHSGEST